MNKTLKAALAATLIVGSAQMARADLTINGAVGLPLNPTAQIPAPGAVRLQANYYDHGDDSSNDFSQYGLYAAGRIADRIEINGGVEKLDVGGGGPFQELDKTGVAIGAKYLFTRESDPVGVRIAAGAGYSRALLKNVHAYVVGTKSLGVVRGRTPVTAHLGLRYDRFKIFSDDSDRVSVFGGVEVPLTAAGDFQFVGELQSKNVDDGKIPYSASVRYRPAGQPYSASLGLQRQGLTGDNGFFLQIGYTFATGAEAGEIDVTDENF